MKKLEVTLKFETTENYDENIGSIRELISHMIDETWDAIYEAGLVPPSYKEYQIKEIDE